MEKIIATLESALADLESLRAVKENPMFVADNPYLLVGRGNLSTAIANLKQVRALRPPAEVVRSSLSAPVPSSDSAAYPKAAPAETHPKNPTATP